MATVKYSVVPKKNPRDKQADPMYYACAQSSGEQTLEDLSKVIEKNCTLTSTDIMAVLHAMDDVMRDQLGNGQIVRIGDLGDVRLSLRGKGSISEEKYTTDLIKCARVVFRPSPLTRKALKSVSYQRVEKRPKKAAAAEVPPVE